MKLVNKSFLLELTEKIEIGELKATLVASVVGTKEYFDVDFSDVDDMSYMGIKITGYDNWKKFKAFHKEMGIDFDEHMSIKFNEIFTKEIVSEFVNKIKF
jgi:hypothetical protein